MSFLSPPCPTALIPPELDVVFNTKPLLWEEDEAEYDALVGQLIAAHNPRDAIEYLLVKDIADAMWEIRRTMVQQEEAVLAALPSAVNAVVKEARGKALFVFAGQEEAADQEVFAVVRQALYGRGGQREFRKLLTKHNIPPRALQAAAYRGAYPFIEKLLIERGAAERRKDKAFRQLEQRRQSLESHRRSLLAPLQRQAGSSGTAPNDV